MKRQIVIDGESMETVVLDAPTGDWIRPTNGMTIVRAIVGVSEPIVRKTHARAIADWMWQR